MTDGYTKRDRKALVKALREGKKFLWDGRSPRPPGQDRMICFAIGIANSSGCVSERARSLCTNLISQRLDGCSGLRTWLRNQGIPESQITNERLQAHRHAWLDLLIAEFSEP